MKRGTLPSRQFDAIMIRSCPPVIRFRGKDFAKSLQQAFIKLPTVRRCVRVMPMGSAIEGTATAYNSGIDLACEIAGINYEQRPSSYAAEFVDGLSPASPVPSRYGAQATFPEVGQVTFVACVRDRDGGAFMADFVDDKWVPTVIDDHLNAIVSFREIHRCVIRFAKLWSQTFESSFDSFRIEAIALEAFLHTEYPSHFHWLLKHFYDVAIDNVNFDRPHPLDPDRVRFRPIEPSSKQIVLTALRKAQGTANNAWFLQESGQSGVTKRPLFLYATLVDPTLVQ